jgi:hypothetical protein
MLAVNSLGAASSGARRSASTEATWAPLFDASVIFTSAPNRRWLSGTGFIDRPRFWGLRFTTSVGTDRSLTIRSEPK